MPDPMYILGNEILSTDWSKFWIEHLEVWAETQYSIGGKVKFDCCWKQKKAVLLLQRLRQELRRLAWS